MKPVAVLCDVHGNLPALEAVLADVERADVDLIVSGGDDVASAPLTADVEAAVAAIRTTGYPRADEITGWLLDPPDPDETSAYFEARAAS